jgi:hypothetical protein
MEDKEIQGKNMLPGTRARELTALPHGEEDADE